jgi:hypothetical protein
MQLPFGSYRHSSRVLAASRLVNVFAEQTTERGPVGLRRAPGVRPFVDLFGGIRGMDVMRGIPYVLSGHKLVSFDAFGTINEIGTINGSSRVSMANNGTQLIIVDDGVGYLATEHTVSQITDPDFRLSGAVDFIDNYIVAVEKNSGRFFASELADASDWEPLNFATAESAPDNLVGLIVDHQEIILAGTDSMELWFNAGTEGFPFARDSNGVVSAGCAAGGSLVRADNSVFWLDNHRIIRRLSGVTPQRVSQYGVEQAIQSYAKVDDCFAFSYTLEGHICVVFQFPSVGRTWVFDITTNEWHERQSEEFSYWQASHCVTAHERIYIGHSTEGKVGTLEPDEYGDWDDTMRCEWTYPVVYANGQEAHHHRFELGIETGQGIPPGQDVRHYDTYTKVTGREVTVLVGVDEAGTPRTPQVLLYASDDGGEFFKSMGARSLGRAGERNTRVHWNRLGPSRQRVYKNVVTDPVKFSVFAADVVADGGRL